MNNTRCNWLVTAASCRKNCGLVKLFQCFLCFRQGESRSVVRTCRCSRDMEGRAWNPTWTV